jgi:hypothetical protein
MATELGVAYISLLPEMKSFRPAAEKGMDRVGKGVATRFGVGFNGAIGSIVSRSAGIFAAGFASVKVGGFLKDAITQASDLGETTSKVGQIFGPAAKDILKFSKTSATALGQTRQAALDANATFGIFGKAAGLQGKELSGFTTELTTLASDLASFNNTSPEQAIEAIGAALRGESEPIRAYGVLLDDASLRQEALKKGLISTTKDALTPQQKVLAAQSLIMKQTTTAQGDFARTSGGLANQQRILSARFSDFKTTIGAVALPLVTSFFGFLNEKGIPAIQGIASRIQDFAGSRGFQNFLADVKAKAQDAFGFFKAEVLPRLGEFAGFITGTVIPAVARFTGFVRDNRTVFTALAVGIGAMVVAFKAYHIAVTTISAVTKAWAVVQAAFNIIMAANPIGALALALIGLAVGLKYAYDHSTKFRNIVNAVFNSVKGVVLGVINALVTAFRAVVGAVTWVVNSVRSVWSTIVSVVSGPLNAIIGFLKAVWSRVYPIIALPVYIAMGLIKGYFKTISAAFTAIKDWVVGAFSAAWNAVKSVLSGPVGDAKRALDTTWSLIKGAFIAVKDWALGTFAKVWGGLKAKLTGPISDAKTALSTILGAAKGGLQWVFSQAVAGIGKVWDGLKETAKTPIRFIIQTVLNDGLIAGFNWVAGKVGAPTIAPIPLPKGFADGGHFDGRLPGAPSAVDNMVGWTRGGPIGLASGEFVVNARQTARNLPLLKAINAGMPGFADGGLFGNLKNGITSAFSKGKDLGADLLGVLENPAKWIRDKMSGPLGRMRELGPSPFIEIVKAVPTKLVDLVAGKAKEFLGGLSLNIGGAGGVNFPGPPGSVRNFRGEPLNTRTINMILAAERLLGGHKFAITQGSYQRATSYSGTTHTGGGVFDSVMHPVFGAAVQALRKVGFAAWDRTGKGNWAPHIHAVAGGDPTASASAKAQYRDYLRGGDGLATGGMVKSVVPKALSFDSGGMLPTGYSVVHNGTGEPEPVGHDFLRKSDLDGMRFVLDAPGVGTLTGHIDARARKVQAATANRLVHEFDVRG